MPRPVGAETRAQMPISRPRPNSGGRTRSHRPRQSKDGRLGAAATGAVTGGALAAGRAAAEGVAVLVFMELASRGE